MGCPETETFQRGFLTVVISKNLTVQTADVNADGSSDIVCTGSDGSMMVWEAKETDSVYDPNTKWTDVNFGFCVYGNKEVIFVPGI